LSILLSRGESSINIIIHLFTGYPACQDKELGEYIEKFQDKYDKRVVITYQSLRIKAKEVSIQDA
jgi:hypothetical protein